MHSLFDLRPRENWSWREMLLGHAELDPLVGRMQKVVRPAYNQQKRRWGRLAEGSTRHFARAGDPRETDERQGVMFRLEVAQALPQRLRLRWLVGDGAKVGLGVSGVRVCFALGCSRTLRRGPRPHISDRSSERDTGRTPEARTRQQSFAAGLMGALVVGQGWANPTKRADSVGRLSFEYLRSFPLIQVIPDRGSRSGCSPRRCKVHYLVVHHPGRTPVFVVWQAHSITVARQRFFLQRPSSEC